MIDFGINTFVGIGPGDSTVKLVKKIVDHNKKEILTFNIGTIQELKDFIVFINK